MKKLSYIILGIFCKFALAIPIYYNVITTKATGEHSFEVLSTIIANDNVCSFKNGELDPGQNHWTACQGLTNLSPENGIKAIYQLDPEGQTIELATTKGDIYHSNNHGFNWVKRLNINVPIGQFLVTALKDHGSDKVFYILNNGAVFKSDAGQVPQIYCQANNSLVITSATLSNSTDKDVNSTDKDVIMVGETNPPQKLDSVLICRPNRISINHPLTTTSTGKLFILPLFDYDTYAVLSNQMIHIIKINPANTAVTTVFGKVFAGKPLSDLHAAFHQNRIYIVAQAGLPPSNFMIFDTEKRTLETATTKEDNQNFSAIYFDDRALENLILLESTNFGYDSSERLTWPGYRTIFSLGKTTYYTP